MTHTKRVVAFVTPEICIHQSLHTYSGGLGVIGGSMVYAAARRHYPLVAVSLLYREGYYDQHIEMHQDGRSRMSVHYIPRRYDDILEDTGKLIRVRVMDSMVCAKVLRLPPERFGASEVIFLDTDIEENDQLSRLNGKRLYPSLASTDNDKMWNDERRIVQSMVLGFGAVDALEELGYDVALYHLNEGHAGFVPHALIARSLEGNASFAEAVHAARKRVVFTTHTPVEAGNPKYSSEQVLRLLGNPRLYPLIEEATSNGYFDLTASCLKHSVLANGVSAKHGDVSRRMWGWLSGAAAIGHVTNGSDSMQWQKPDLRLTSTSDELHLAKRTHKRFLLEYIRAMTGKQWSDDVCTIVWARRFAGYKRPGLLLSDYAWTERLLSENKLQIIYAGKPHPDDHAMINEWNNILRLSVKLPNLAVLPGYEMELSRTLKAGADVWLNNPAAPFEACGTSGQSAAMNGAINCSTPDGWCLEANERNYFRFGLDRHTHDQDVIDATELRDTIDAHVLPLYYGDKRAWYEMALAAKREAETVWSSERMFSDYLTKIYGPAMSLQIMA